MNGCWDWIAARYQNGYGYVRIPHTRKNTMAHRMAWMLTYGEIPDGMYVCHHCDNPSCVNPEHLFLGTQKDNMRDMNNKKRSNHQGIHNSQAKITKHDADIIRARTTLGEPRRWLAIEYGLAKSTVQAVITAKTWR